MRLPKVLRPHDAITQAELRLPDSVSAFPEGDDFVTILSGLGYQSVDKKLLSGGIATIYFGFK